MADRPNIIVILSDQQRWDTCGCYGLPGAELARGGDDHPQVTPNLDRMAAEGVRFENAFTCQPLCGPARAALQTGRYPTEIGCHTNHRLLPVDDPTIAKTLGDSGYETAYIGKWHLASCGPRGGEDDFRLRPVPPERRGGYRDFWLAADALEHTSHSYDGHMFGTDGETWTFPEGRYRADAQTDWVIDYLEQYRQHEPFFLFVSYIEPHHQNDHGHYEGPEGSKERFKNFVPPADLADLDGNWREEYPDYLGCINSLDYNLGRIRDTMEKLGFADNTVMLYTSDHGSHFMTRNNEYKRSCHDACIRVPFVAHGPGFDGGKVPRDLVSLIDLPATVLHAAGVSLPPTMRGRPLQELVAGAEDWRDDVFLQISESQCGRAVRTQKWKYSARAPQADQTAPGADHYVDDCLYDLEADPHELNNLVGNPAYMNVIEELRKRLKQNMVAAGEKEPGISAAP